jgi:hypothetical protein
LDPLDAINEAVALHAGWLEEALQKGNTDGTVQRWTRRMHALQDAAKELAALRANRETPGGTGEPDDMSDLPAALIAQLSGPKTDALEDQVLDVMRSVGGQVELNRLLIELYRRHGDVHERKALNNKAYRMVQKGLIHQAPDRRGAYSLDAA